MAARSMGCLSLEVAVRFGRVSLWSLHSGLAPSLPQGDGTPGCVAGGVLGAGRERRFVVGEAERPL
ncbi:hypothetical protein ADK41_12025 [Streptomyces caelestis]|uniref:Uncharacterized protein n=1 Tax=Streptomyces caelestis TaxID=36816 RepID=A0A0M8QMN9_9ACTN|nr:hypothetical protein ADK41_12025 [Streptomyces caelestis]